MDQFAVDGQDVAFVAGSARPKAFLAVTVMGSSRGNAGCSPIIYGKATVRRDRTI
jgi:hypothetical protein